MPRLTSSIAQRQFQRESVFVYPAHIDADSLQALPQKPGIYIFRGEDDAPLYVGKSVNIRSRVLAHLRAPEEARMLAQSRRVEFQRTAGDIGAQLLESRLIKQLQPLHNIRLRRKREMCALTLNAAGALEVVYARELDFTTAPGLYGVFASRYAALEVLRKLVDTHALCSVACGLEPARKGRPCFARQLHQCQGACVGAESLASHTERLRQALESLRIIQWPFEQAMGIVEQCDGWRQTHVIDHWMYLGSLEEGQRAFKRPRVHAFDIDTYKIIVKPYLEGCMTPLE